MKKLFLNQTALVLTVFLMGVAGCDKGSTLQTPLSVGELPAAFEKAFAKAKPEIKGLADQVVKAVQAQDYSKAFQDIQTLGAQLNLTKEQNSTIGRATLTINELLQTAATKGDEKAAATRESYRRNK